MSDFWFSALVLGGGLVCILVGVYYFWTGKTIYSTTVDKDD